MCFGLETMAQLTIYICGPRRSFPKEPASHFVMASLVPSYSLCKQMAIAGRVDRHAFVNTKGDATAMNLPCYGFVQCPTLPTRNSHSLSERRLSLTGSPKLQIRNVTV